MNFAREGLLFIAIAAVVAAGAFGLALNAALVATLAARRSCSLLIALWVAYFFRDPERTGERGPTLVVAPADGKVDHDHRSRRADLRSRAARSGSRSS